ncbi:pyrroline-5-carboxylate reductase [Subsaximicrobium wynnwilliamsii]|uniref:Pyrroline-5-carboxylate reductase n=1 Tax=Subsaximicrobium wynnwilliamsii TaxID=291179 RepID=A0A5C6ZG74_9FLAO|nr:pyrroline-5-carboxylate reductase [Subsaximicrobium wynnwilliamsii]TXD83375.1 pyrroline-5-carboxylate reductase [Subsaximicrobium wynnwilliamsii]TXD89088.1 pyrroline-5-carboxylate reductase [Subsaximicrobium wynnwilliamsii]TXE03399.1 pyrroline-5-carboxylate reductase [Subsaximicrobium wynnwilliamsii]
MKVLVIGAGNMGLTYAEGMATSPLLSKHKLRIYDTDPKKIKSLRAEGIFDVFESLEDCLPKADIIFVAVKPYHCEGLFEEMKPMLNDQQLIVSLMAGVTLQTIQDQLNIDKVVRTMPNLPAQVGKGVTSYTASKAVSKVELIMVRNLLDTTGTSIHVDTENFIDASTGISGSGPAYVFYFMQSMLEAALKMGFSDYDSKVLVSNTFEGAIELFNQNDISPKSWIDKVASKGGTTQAAIDSMEDNNIKELIKDAAYAAFDRAVELGKK